VCPPPGVFRTQVGNLRRSIHHCEPPAEAVSKGAKQQQCDEGTKTDAETEQGCWSMQASPSQDWLEQADRSASPSAIRSASPSAMRRQGMRLRHSASRSSRSSPHFCR